MIFTKPTGLKKENIITDDDTEVGKEIPMHYPGEGDEMMTDNTSTAHVYCNHTLHQLQSINHDMLKFKTSTMEVTFCLAKKEKKH